MPQSAPSGYKLERKWSATHFAIGLFGATAILGVMAKIFNFEAEIMGVLITWEPLVLIGFIGEAAVFIIMGLIRDFEYVPTDEDEEAVASAGPAVSEDVRNLGDHVGGATEQLTQEAEWLAQEMQAMREALASQNDVYQELSELRGRINEATTNLRQMTEMFSEELGRSQEVMDVGATFAQDVAGFRDNLRRAGDGLVQQAEALESNIEDMQALYQEQAPVAGAVAEIRRDLTDESKQLNEEIAEARRAMKTMRAQFEQAARRFQQFNQPSSMENGADTTQSYR